MSFAFEMGPIRPPSEATSVLVRVTRNCPWNRCAFCNTYRAEKFSRRTVEEVMRDIDNIKTIADRILEAAGGDLTRISSRILLSARGLDITPVEYYRQVLFWLSHGVKSAFLQDANSLIMSTDDLVTIIRHLKEKFPSIERITSYARSKTISKKSLEEMKRLREAGLSRLHVGMESGCDEVLTMVDKGVSAEDHIDAGRKAIEAGFDLSEYYMPGLGGKALWEKNARESARVVNAINPTFVRIRSTIPLSGTPLGEMMKAGVWQALSEEEKVREIRLFIELLDGVTSYIVSDHMMNLLEEIEGKLPMDKAKMLETIDRFLSWSMEDKEIFIIGRRLGQFRYLDDYVPTNELMQVRSKLIETFGTVDSGMIEILQNYI
ncbi:MAG: radical SAM protein [Spirochaetes bacterium]|nr:radical SAM protein [Spirochaetota bacterium]